MCAKWQLPQADKAFYRVSMTELSLGAVANTLITAAVFEFHAYLWGAGKGINCNIFNVPDNIFVMLSNSITVSGPVSADERFIVMNTPVRSCMLHFTVFWMQLQTQFGHKLTYCSFKCFENEPIGQFHPIIHLFRAKLIFLEQQVD